MDITVIFALITALAAIVAPVVTAYIQRKSALELKKIEIIYSQKLSAYRTFADKSGKLFLSNLRNQFEEIKSAAYNASLFADQKTAKLLHSIAIEVTYAYDKDFDLSPVLANIETCVDLLNSDLKKT